MKKEYHPLLFDIIYLGSEDFLLVSSVDNETERIPWLLEDDFE